VRTLDSDEKLPPALMDYFEDADTATSMMTRLYLRIICRLMPTRLIARLFVRGSTTDVDEIATILFSYRADAPNSPRGAMLTHHNLLSNLESPRQIFHVTREDCILGLIPFSDAMSFAGTLLLPALTGARVALRRGTHGKTGAGSILPRESHHADTGESRDARIDDR
jgi:acyl-CoA synthetase (AMP-forming)/AMP-acid ligase II